MRAITAFGKIVLAAAVITTLAVAYALANPYQGIRYETTTGKVYEHLSGEFALAASTGSWSTYTITMNGADGSVSASSATFTGGYVKLSTSSTAGDSMCFLGARAALPTTGFPRGCLLYLTTEPTKIYISTETVVGVQSWLGK